MRYERYTVVAKLSKDKDIQVSTLIYCMGPQAEQIFNSFTFAAEGDKDDPAKVMEKFDSHFVLKRNVIFERAKFNQRCQEAGENIETYVCALFDLAEHCEYGDKKEDFIRDRLVIGLLDKDIRTATDASQANSEFCHRFMPTSWISQNTKVTEHQQYWRSDPQE